MDNFKVRKIYKKHNIITKEYIPTTEALYFDFKKEKRKSLGICGYIIEKYCEIKRTDKESFSSSVLNVETFKKQYRLP
ncbi:MAG: hypothetical protein HN576_06365 [Bacteriovoracaceae bacterium]|nr:hypothetical protein [Bacteriovoracaceae bacterium]